MSQYDEADEYVWMAESLSSIPPHPPASFGPMKAADADWYRRRGYHVWRLTPTGPTEETP